jgi:hypothetical protein
MLISRAALSASVLLAGVGVADAACGKPDRQSVERFYNADTYGQFGVLGRVGDLSGNLYIIDKNRCFDLSFSQIRKIQMVFNSKVRTQDAAGPTYLGALTVSLWYGSDPSRSAISTSFYRNAGIQRTDSRWASPKDRNELIAVDRDANLGSDAIELYDRPYRPNGMVQTTTLNEINGVLRDAAAQGSPPVVRNWHALVVQPAGNNYVVRENSAEAQRSWILPALDDGPSSSPRVYMVQNYLTKFETSSSPSRDVLFEIELSGSPECVYVRIVGPEGNGSPLVLPVAMAGSYITFKMKRDVNCD